MGLFGKIWSGVKAACGAVSRGISSIAHFVSSGISKVASAACSVGSGVLKHLSGVASGVSKFLTPVLGPLAPIASSLLTNLAFDFIGKVTAEIAEAFGITEEKEDPAEIGYRIVEAENHPEWEQREECDSFSEYYGKLKEHIPEVNHDEINANPMYYGAIGIGIEWNEISEHTGMELSSEFVSLIGMGKITQEEVKLILGLFQKENLKGQDVMDFLQHRMSVGAEKIIRGKILDLYGELYPDKTREELDARIETIMTAQSAPETFYKLYKPDALEALKIDGKQKEIAMQEGATKEELEQLKIAIENE